MLAPTRQLGDALRLFGEPTRLRILGLLELALGRPQEARPLLDWRLDYFTVWPHVKNLIPHQSLYNFGRLQEVWVDK